MNYADIIKEKYTDHLLTHIANNDGTDYNNLIWNIYTTPISKEQLDADILEYDKKNSLFLDNGLPAYFYEPYNDIISIDATTFVFSMKTGGAKNFWLNSGNADGSTSGYFISSNSIIKKIMFASKNSVGSGVSAIIKDPTNSNVNFLTANITESTKSFSLLNQTGLIPANSQISCYIAAQSNVQDITIVIDVAQRN